MISEHTELLPRLIHRQFYYYAKWKRVTHKPKILLILDVIHVFVHCAPASLISCAILGRDGKDSRNFYRFPFVLSNPVHHEKRKPLVSIWVRIFLFCDNVLINVTIFCLI